MKGYKAFNKGLICRDFQYEVGKTYKYDGKIELCEAGFHFCQKASDCACYYDPINSDFAEVEAIGEVIEGRDKCVTNEIRIIRLISNSEFYKLINNGRRNVGAWNNGHGNTGHSNTGNWNVGDRNTGRMNTGSLNTGASNTGGRNAGSCNIGNWNAGSRNIGNKNTGRCNTGNGNSGDWNNTSWSTGFFCSEPQTVKIFDIDTGKEYEDVIDLLPGVLWYIPFGHYWLNDEPKIYTAEDRQRFYDELEIEDKKLIQNIPNFNADKFKECTGIEVESD